MHDTSCPAVCPCHHGPYTPCAGGRGKTCATRGCPQPGANHIPDTLCRTGTRCPGYTPSLDQPNPATPAHPLCDACLTAASRDIAHLLYDWVDLEQLHNPAMSQALDPQPHGDPTPPMPLNAAADTLMAEIRHTTTTWADITCTRIGQPEPAPARPGREVQRATALLAHHTSTLARTPATAVYPTGCEDPPQDVTGWQAVHHLQHLRRRARSLLGWTRPTRRLPGTCPQCHAPIQQDTPRRADDPTPVYCTRHCGWQIDHNHYETWVVDILTPQPAA